MRKKTKHLAQLAVADVTFQFRFTSEQRSPNLFQAFAGAGTGINAPANSPSPEPVMLSHRLQRMGNPLINELLVGTGFKDRFSKPSFPASRS